MHPRKRLLEVKRWSYPKGPCHDRVILEDPLQITLQSAQGNPASLRLGTILRTPGHDYELVFGYLYSLRLIEKASDVREISYCSAPQTYNHLSVHFRGPIPAAAVALRSQEWIHGGCGACGQDSVEVVPPHRVAPFSQPVESAWLRGLPEQLLQSQELFEHCGGVHAAALAQVGQPLSVLHEDVGRHNAVDKLIGHLLMNQQLAARGRWLVLSGRAGFELVQKAVQAGFSGVASLGPPSSLGIAYAQQAGLCLVGFLDSQRFNVYSQPGSIADLGAD